MAEDWIEKVVNRIHAEYPRILSECNEHTPRPWLHAVIREAMEDVAYMSVPRCDGCKHWIRRGIRNYCENKKLHLQVSLLFDPPIETAADFGCVQWEAK